MKKNQEPGTSARGADPDSEYRGVADQLAQQLEQFVTEISEELAAISSLLGDQPLEISLKSNARRKPAPEKVDSAEPVKPAGTARLSQLKKRLANLKQGGETGE